MNRKLLILLAAIITAPLTSGQSLEEYLRRVEDNNREILAYKKLLEARSFEARTGNAPAGPFISGGIMPGSPESAGTKKTWSVSQSFAFPTKYLLQKKINLNTIKLAEQEFNMGKLNILLEAKGSYLDLLYNTRYLKLLSSRKEGYDRLEAAWKKMLENGQATIMDYNRIMMEISAVNLDITRTRADIEMLREKLSVLSGSDSSITPEDYTPVIFTSLEDVLREKEVIHPAYLIPGLESELSLQEVKMSRAGALPELEIGYQSEIVPGETYSGPAGGISVPLWSNSGRVKAASARAEHLSAHREAMLQKLKSEVKNEYSNMKALQQSISELRNILGADSGKRHLDTALNAGEISVTTYFTYLEATFRAEDRLLDLENEFYKSLARLLDHELMK